MNRPDSAVPARRAAAILVLTLLASWVVRPAETWVPEVRAGDGDGANLAAGDTTAGAEVEPPGQVEGFGRRYVEAVNSADPRERRETIRTVFSTATLNGAGEDRLLHQMERLAADLAPLQFHHAEVIESRVGGTVRRSLHVFARSRDESRWRDLQFRLEEASPHKIVDLVFIADVAEPVSLPNGSIDDPGTIAWLHGYIDKLTATEDLSGALMIAVGDDPIVERYFGYADSARTVPCSRDTRFNLGSGDKMLTAVAAALLVESGELAFETPVDRFLPGYANRAWAASATLGHLLSHTSGAGEYWTAENAPEMARAGGTRDLLPLVERAPVDFAPGEGARYSNSNFILAGLIVEVASGMDYHEFVRSRILEPCGMRNTGVSVRDGSSRSFAEALTGERGAWRRAATRPRGSSAGGGFSTAGDILRFSRCLTAGRIVDPSMLALMTSSKTAGIAGAELDYGYGFTLQHHGGGLTSYGHGGIAPGVNFEYRYFPRGDVTLIAFSNQDNGAYDSLRRTATQLVTGER